MTDPQPRDRFIPFRKADLAAMCRQAGLVPQQAQSDFNDFRRILEALLHFEYHHLIDTAEEEEFKEALLAYLFLAQNEAGLTRRALDDAVELWLEKDWDCAIDFEVDDALDKLERWGLVQHQGNRLTALPLAEAKACLDHTWDNFFSYQQA